MDLGVIVICDTCKDLKVTFEWLQLALDASHVVRYLGAECQCGFHLVECEVIDCG